MNTNEKIAKWLGMVRMNEMWCKPNEDETVSVYPKNYILDFLHDRNQQKWIEDKLIELGYGIMHDYIQSDNSHNFSLYIGQTVEYTGENESKDLAFISAVEQLINKENEHK